jgi:hypothetical protein
MKLEAHRGRLHRYQYIPLGISPVGISRCHHVKQEAQAGRAQAPKSGSTDDRYTSLLALVVLQQLVHKGLSREEGAETLQISRAKSMNLTFT